MNVISFSLFGADPKYRAGMLENVQASTAVYPGWHLHIHCDRPNYTALLEHALGVHVHLFCPQETSEGSQGMSWRFRSAASPEADAVLFRDADSQLTRREAQAVEEWLKSGFDVHLIRDHPAHTSPIMGGMFGVRRDAKSLLARQLMHDSQRYRLTSYGDDQVFLATVFYPRIRHTALLHTSCIRYFGEFTLPLRPQEVGELFIGAYAHLTREEQEAFEQVRRDYGQMTLALPSWTKKRILKVIVKRFLPVRRIRHGCRWCV